MAYQGVNVPVQDDAVTRRAKKGGGGIGQIAGTVGGAILGGAAIAATGGAAAPAVAMGAMGGAAAGGGLGGMVGEMIDPSRAASTAMSRRGGAGPQMLQTNASETLKQSIMALHSQPDHIKSEYTEPLVTAYLKSSAQRGAV